VLTSHKVAENYDWEYGNLTTEQSARTGMPTQTIRENDEQPSSIGSQEVSKGNGRVVYSGSSFIAESELHRNVTKPLLDNSLPSRSTVQTAPQTGTIPATAPDANFSNARHWQPGRWDWWPAPRPSEILGIGGKELSLISPKCTITSAEEIRATQEVDYRKCS
jgi:hypothetical protein